jgi:hypothetical protein
VVVESGNLVPRPAKVSWEQAGALFVAGTTAYAAVRSVALTAGDTVVDQQESYTGRTTFAVFGQIGESASDV